MEMNQELVVAPLDDGATLASANLLATEQRGFNVAGSDTRQCAFACHMVDPHRMKSAPASSAA